MRERALLIGSVLLATILLVSALQTITAQSSGPPFSDPSNDLVDENGKPVAAEPYLDIVSVDLKRSGENYVWELVLNGAVPDNVESSLWIDWGVLINSGQASGGWGGPLYNNLGADLFVRLGMQGPSRLPQICQLYPSFSVTGAPSFSVEGSKITLTVTSSIGALIDSGSPWIVVARKWDESGQKEHLLAMDKAPNDGYYSTRVGTSQTTQTMQTTTRIISGLNRSVGVEVNPNIELLSVVLSMTTWGKQSPAVREILGVKYQDDIEKWFSTLKGHPAVSIAQQLTNEGFTYDAPPNFILHFGPPPKMEKLYPYGDYLVGRAGSADILDRFADALKDFASASKFMDFYNQHLDFYNKILSTYQDVDMRTLVFILESFWGEQRGGYHIVVAASMSRPGGGYGIRIPTTSGDICYEIYRASNPLYSSSSLYSLGLHEFSHSFVNDMVDQFAGRVNNLGYLFTPVTRQMDDMAYTSIRVMMFESIIRAFEALQSTIQYGPSAGTNRILSEMKQGFYFTDTIYNLLVDYLYNTNNYKTFAAYLPTIFTELSKISPEEAQKEAIASLSSPTASLKSAPLPAAAVTLVAKSGTLLVNSSSNVRLELRNTGAIAVYARTVVSTTPIIQLLNETVYEVILKKNETRSFNLAIKTTSSVGAASVRAQVFYSSRLLDDKTCGMEIVGPGTTVTFATTATTEATVTGPSASFPLNSILPIAIGVGVALILGSFIALRKRGKTVSSD
jgi:hypothetical protein